MFSVVEFAKRYFSFLQVFTLFFYILFRFCDFFVSTDYSFYSFFSIFKYWLLFYK